ncbi:PKD domain-containing protein [Gracilimonas mengyeensis]|nr:DUF1565 domain-containing protein [Gracilimonas mengyeensis]
MRSKIKLFYLLIPVMLIWGCSENGTGPNDPDGDDDGDNPPATTLTADAGEDTDEIVGFLVTADGSDSDGDGTLSYSWSFINTPENSTASLANAETENPEFTPDLPGEYSLELEVSSGDESETDTVTYSAIAKRIFVDANDGTEGDIYGFLEESSLKTISSALSLYEENPDNDFLDIDTIFVDQGLYDEANGENFPLDFSGELLVIGEETAAREDVHILSPDVDRDPAVYLGEGVTIRHLHIENGYTGGTFNGDPDAVFVKSGSSPESSYVTLENVTLRTNNNNGYIMSTGSNINVEVNGINGSRSTLDAKGIGRAYTHRFNTSNVRVDMENTDIMGIGNDDAFALEAASNGNLYLINSTIKPGAESSQNNAAINIGGPGTVLLDNTTITSSDGTESGNRFKFAIDMDADHPGANVDIQNSTLQYTLWSAIEMYASVFQINDSVIEGVHTQSTADGADLARSGIDQLDGTLILRGTTIRNSNGNAITIDGPVSPNDDDFIVDLGKENTPGQNTFQDIDGFDVLVGRGSDDVAGEIPAIGNTWSNGSASPTCGNELPGSSENAQEEVYISTDPNSLRWGTAAGETCN